MPRRLSAILIADVVSYSRLVEADEAGTLAALKQRWKTILEPTAREHGGRIVKEMGDGVLVEFASAVDAVLAGNELQRRMEVANNSLPDDRRIILRIGINLGDVIGEGSDIYGESVNVAARLETLSQPGGLCISEKVYGEIRGKVEIVFEDVGEQNLKNISAPVRAYLTRAGVNAQPVRHLPQSSDPSIAVLPFADLSGEQDQRYFSDGITEDIITELSRFRQLEVVARNSSFRFRGSDLDMIKVGRELGVAYLLEGSVRQVGTRIRITAQLIDAKSGHHLWAEKFDRDREEIFAIQDQVVRTIVTTLVGRLQTAIVERAKRKPPSNLAAYECVLRADALPFGTADSETEARRLLEKAIALDPGYARAYAYMGNSYRLEWSRDMSGSDELLDQALSFTRKSVELDENNDACHQDLGWVLMHRHAYELAEHHFHKALQLNPNRPSSLTSIGCLYAYLGRPDEALGYFEAARSLDPSFEPSWYWRMLGVIFFVARRHDEAIAAFKKSPIIPSWVHGYLAACYIHTNRIADAKRRKLCGWHQIFLSFSRRLRIHFSVTPTANTSSRVCVKQGCPINAKQRTSGQARGVVDRGDRFDDDHNSAQVEMSAAEKLSLQDLSPAAEKSSLQDLYPPRRRGNGTPIKDDGGADLGIEIAKIIAAGPIPPHRAGTGLRLRDDGECPPCSPALTANSPKTPDRPWTGTSA